MSKRSGEIRGSVAQSHNPFAANSSASYSRLICPLRHLMALAGGAFFTIAKLKGNRSLRELPMLDVGGFDTVEHGFCL
jgi:hypothetical protein